MILIDILIGLILFWFTSGFLTGILAVSARNAFLHQSASAGDFGTCLVCGLMGPYIMVRCIMAVFGR